jgi:hypothetical protein
MMQVMIMNYFVPSTWDSRPDPHKNELTRVGSINIPGAGVDWLDGSYPTLSTAGSGQRWPSAATNPIMNGIVAAKCVAQTAGTYLVRGTADDGFRLYLNDVLVANDWTDHAVTTYTAPSATLAVGDEVMLLAYTYNQNGGGNRVRGEDNSIFYLSLSPLFLSCIFSPSFIASSPFLTFL